MRPWFGPAPTATDYLQLFTEPERWAQARAHVEAFVFYIQHVLSADPEPTNPNSYNRLVDVDAFRKLREWGIPLVLEIGCVKAGSASGCDGSHYLHETQVCIDRIEAAAGSVAVIAIDEPLVGGAACRQAIAQTTAATARSIKALRAFRPYVSIVLVEAYPASRGTTIADVLTTLMRDGALPDGLTLDIDRYGIRDQGLELHQVRRDLQALRTFCTDSRIPMGLIAWGQRVTTDADYRRDVLRWVQPPERGDKAKWPIAWAKHALVSFDRIVLQSFEERRPGDSASKDIPRNLPETDVGSHTHLLLEISR